MRDCIKARMKGLFLVSLLCFVSLGNILYAQKEKRVSDGFIPLSFTSDGSHIQGWFFQAEGTGPFPTVILLHGFPGSEGDLFRLGQKMAGNGINAFSFNYRGTWGSEGEFNLENTQADIQAAVDFLHRDEIISRFKVDTSDIILGGYSYGGGMALTYATYHGEIKKVFSIAGTDHGEITREYLRNESFAQMINKAFDSYRVPEGPIRFEGHAAWKELIDHVDYYDLRLSADKLAQKEILLIGGWDDINVSIDDHLLPLYRALKKENAQNVRFIAHQTDHSFENCRDELARGIVEWIKSGSTQELISSDESVIHAIKQIHEAAATAVKNGDVAAEVGLFTEDGIYMWPGAPSVIGREALRAWFEKQFREVSAELNKTMEEVVVMGDWAFERGSEVSKITSRSTGDVTVVHGKYINIYRRQQDGSWKVARRIRNLNHPPPSK